MIQLSDFNKMEDTYVADPVEVSFGEDLTGWVLLPKDYDETKKISGYFRYSWGS